MSGYNLRARKYRVTFEIDLYAPTTGIAYSEALDHLVEVIEKHRRLQMFVALERAKSLPNGGLEGAPHGDGLDGWMCNYTIDEAKP